MNKLPWEKKGFYNSEMPPDPMEETNYLQDNNNNKNEKTSITKDTYWNQDFFILDTIWENDQTL